MLNVQRLKFDGEGYCFSFGRDQCGGLLNVRSAVYRVVFSVLC